MVGQDSGPPATGLHLFWQQCRALLKKNALLSIRNKRATFLQLAASCFFVFLMFAVDRAIQADIRDTTGFKNVREPEAKAVTPIPACESGFYIKSEAGKPCYDFLYSGDGSISVQTIVRNIRERNPGRPIPESKVMGFAAPSDVDYWLLRNAMRCPGALHFQDRGPDVIAYGIQTNSTIKLQRGNFEDQLFKFRMPLQAAAEREIARFIADDPDLGWDVRFTEFAHPAIDTISTVGTIGPTFLLVAAMFGFVIQISNLVTERELKLRQAMSLMGLFDSAYWLTWLLWEVFLALVSSLLLVAFGKLLQFDLFLNNDFLVSFFLFFLFQVNMTGFAFMISTLISKASSATTAGFVVFIVGFVTQGAIYNWLLGRFLVWFILAIYFDNVVPDVNGVRKSFFYFVLPSYWTGRAKNVSKDEDVLAEKELVKQQPPAQGDDPNIAVQVRGLVKTFPGVATSGCCKCKRTAAYHAVKGTWFNIEKDKLFCMLGPNGAGKTTTINCLTGIIPTTSGDGLIYGQSIRDPAGISQIRSFMGVCPQSDILWESLSGQEHLHLFASIKGIPCSDIKSVADELLAQVKLSDAADDRLGSFSGGMKRRLSVAIALIGDPFLDEPTTGMDPITRRHVWDVIEVAKMGRAIVLTTHSMEEAEILGDRIAIMAKGQLRCIGTSIHLKSRFGSGYVVNVSVRKGTREALSPEEDERRKINVRKYFLDGLGVVPSEERKSYISFIVPRKFETKLSGFFLGLHEREQELGVTNMQLGLTTLDEVFLKVAQQAELETASIQFDRYRVASNFLFED